MKKKINKVIKVLMVSDFFLNSALGLFSPVFALFIMNRISFGSATEAAKVAGFATLCYWGVKSILQIPISIYIDKNHGEKDDFWFMFLGIFIVSIAPIGFIYSYLPWHIYVFNMIQSVGMAMLIPSWYAIFTRHIDRGREAFEWGVNSSTLSMGVGITGALGGIMAATYGFTAIFILTTSINLVSLFALLTIRNNLYSGDHHIFKIPPITPF
jgi:predicted MFS family arabinose efflux permease